MIIKILITQRQAMNTLREQLRNGMLHKTGVTPIAKARRQASGHSKPVINLAKEERPGPKIKCYHLSH
jgi:hypothetical protein